MQKICYMRKTLKETQMINKVKIVQKEIQIVRFTRLRHSIIFKNTAGWRTQIYLSTQRLKFMHIFCMKDLC
jgi:hypothetical protein